MVIRIIFSFIIFVGFKAYAALDYEVGESLKCTKLFSYFEKKYELPIDTLHSIALKESGKAHSIYKIKVVWPWTVNVEGQGYYFNSKYEAVSFVNKQILNGKQSIDVGCMQINLKNHPKAFLSIDHAFDPKTNIAYGAAFLRSKYEQTKDWHKAVAHYHSATHELGSKYKQEVIKISANMPHYRKSLKNHVLNYPSSIKNYGNNSGIMKVAANGSLSKSKSYFSRKKSRLSYNRIHSNLMIPVH